MIEGEMGLEPAEMGIYAFDLWLNLPQTPKPLGDSDTRCSPFMTILPWKDEKGGEFHEAEYYGYDDKGTEEESDEEHIFLVRYGLRCGSAMLDDDGDWVMRAFVDEDGDGRLDEDWMDGIDNDNDGRIDEDPPGYCDEDWKDGLDNDKDGLVDEDPPNPVDASAGYILVYDPDLEPLRDEQGKIRRIDIRSLPCVVHRNETDGLHANLEGVYHGVLVRLPASFMQKAGEYRFVIQAYDNHAHLHKDHQVKPALERNQQYTRPLPIVWISGRYANTTWYGIWCRDPQFVRRLTLWRRRGELVTDRMNVTNLGEVKGICNGGFFSQRDLTLIGHVGIGNTWVGNDIVRRDRLDRYAFGMMGAGRDFDFNILPMDVSQREDGNYVHSLLPRIRQNYPYGLSGIGLLVDNGQGQPQPESNIRNSPFQGRDSRTAIAWTTDRMHFFIIVARNYDGSSLREGWTWRDTVNFFTTELPNWMINDLPNWMQTFRNQLIRDGVVTQNEASILLPDRPVNIQIGWAIMLDGGGSSQIAWRWRRSNGREARRQHLEHRRTREGRWIPRRVPTFVEVTANAP
jgi:hypothetical protein